MLDLTDEQLIAAMENAVSRVAPPGAEPIANDRFPQIAGMFVEYDANQAPLEGLETVSEPSRIKTLVVTRVDGSEDVVIDNFMAQGDLSCTFRLATNSFIAGDGYAAFAAARVVLSETGTGEQQILEDYITGPLGSAVDLPEPLADPRVVHVLP